MRAAVVRQPPELVTLPTSSREHVLAARSSALTAFSHCAGAHQDFRFPTEIRMVISAALNWRSYSEKTGSDKNSILTGRSYSNCQIGTLHCCSCPAHPPCLVAFVFKAFPLFSTNLFALLRFARQYPNSPHPSRSLQQHTLIAIMFHFSKGAMPWLLLAVSRFGM